MHSSFSELGLAPFLTRAVAEQGYSVPTPIQARAIPTILAGRDVLAAAQTGTGKTAAFTLPLLQRLAPGANTSASPARHPVRALVLTPTRELAAQVHESVTVYGRHVPLRAAVIYGGVGMNPQIEELRRGVEILVATPGRLLDHAAQKTVDLGRMEILVLDEADRMLDMGFIRDIRRILALLPQARQNLLFSATFSPEIRSLAGALLHDPVSVEVAPRNAQPVLVTQRVHAVSSEQKRHALAHLVRAGDWQQVLVFTRTKHGANRLAEQLDRAGISAVAIHGNKSQPQRLKALAQFKQGEVRVLVATDIAARGLDIEALPHVVNFDLPHVPEDYVHRIGRTGRAGASGEAISLVSPDQHADLAAIEKLIGRRLAREPIPGFDAYDDGARTKPVAATRSDPSPARPSQPAKRPAPDRGDPRRAARDPRRERNDASTRHAPEAHPQLAREASREREPQRSGDAGLLRTVLRTANRDRHGAASRTPERSDRRPVGALLGGMPFARDER